MQCLEVSGAVRPLYGSLVKGLKHRHVKVSDQNGFPCGYLYSLLESRHRHVKIFIVVTLSAVVKNSTVRCVCTVPFSQKHCLAPHKSG